LLSVERSQFGQLGDQNRDASAVLR
jgi:hypothetical protein